MQVKYHRNIIFNIGLAVKIQFSQESYCRSVNSRQHKYQINTIDQFSLTSIVRCELFLIYLTLSQKISEHRGKSTEVFDHCCTNVNHREIEKVSFQRLHSTFPISQYFFISSKSNEENRFAQDSECITYLKQTHDNGRHGREN